MLSSAVSEDHLCLDHLLSSYSSCVLRGMPLSWLHLLSAQNGVIATKLLDPVMEEKRLNPSDAVVCKPATTPNLSYQSIDVHHDLIACCIKTWVLLCYNMDDTIKVLRR